MRLGSIIVASSVLAFASGCASLGSGTRPPRCDTDWSTPAMIDYIEAFRPDREGIPRRYVELEDKLDQLDAYCHAMEAYRGDGD